MQCYVEENAWVPPEQSGFRPSRSSSGCIVELTSAMDDARAHRDNAIQTFFLYRTCVRCSNTQCLAALGYIGVPGLMMCYFEPFFRDRTYPVQLQSLTDPVHSLSWGVPHGSCLSPTLFNIAMATLLFCVPSTFHPDGRIIDSDDSCVWATQYN